MPSVAEIEEERAVRLELCPAGGSIRTLDFKACLCGMHTSACKPNDLLEYFYKMAEKEDTDAALLMKSIAFVNSIKSQSDRLLILWISCLGVVVSGKKCAQWSGRKKALLDAFIDASWLEVAADFDTQYKRGFLYDIANWTLVRPNNVWLRYNLKKSVTPSMYCIHIMLSIPIALAKNKPTEAHQWVEWYNNNTHSALSDQKFQESLLKFKEHHPAADCTALSMAGDPGWLFKVNGVAFFPRFKNQYEKLIASTDKSIQKWAEIVGINTPPSKKHKGFYCITTMPCKHDIRAEFDADNIEVWSRLCACCDVKPTIETIKNNGGICAEISKVRYTWTLQCGIEVSAVIIDGLYMGVYTDIPESVIDIGMLKSILRIFV